MSAGRPTKYNALTDLPLLDGQVTIDPSTVSTNDFKSEDELNDYIEQNIELFCRDVLSDNYMSHKREYEGRVFGRGLRPRGRRVDFLIICENKDYLIESKRPTNKRENTAAIGQLLDYGRTFLDPKKRTDLILLTTCFDIETGRTIRHYNLPIRFIFFDKQRSLEFYGE